MSWFNQSIGELELTDTTVRCTLRHEAGYSRWLGERLQIPDLEARLKAGEPVIAFEFSRNTYQITWKTFNSIFKINDGDGRDWRVGLPPFTVDRRTGVVYPAILFPRYGGKKVRQRWRDVLDHPESAIMLD